MIYQRNNYALNTAATYADPYRLAQYRPSDPSYARQPIVMDDGATRSPSIDSIQKDPRLAPFCFLFHSHFWHTYFNHTKMWQGTVPAILQASCE